MTSPAGSTGTRREYWPWARRAVARGAASALAVTLVAGPVPAATAASATPATPATAATALTALTAFGTLGSNPAHATADAAAGVRYATVTVGWNMWEPSRGHVDGSWVRYVRREVRAYRAHRQAVVVELGLQYTPSWVLDLPGGQLINQYGQRSGTPNYEWDPAVRRAMVRYVRSVVEDLRPVHPLGYRIGLSTTGEMLYGDGSSTSWWAYGRAQTSSPLRGWVPGETTWRRRRVTRAQAARWYGWYLGGLVHAEHAEIAAIRGAGYRGRLLLLMPGDGTTPSEYARRIAADLGAASTLDAYGTMDTGAVWWLQLRRLKAMGGLSSRDVVDVTSMGDGSGWEACRGGDTRLRLTRADPWVSHWDDTRWLAYLARTHGFGIVGENSGGNDDGQMASIVRLARGCGLAALFWQNDDSLYAGGGNATLGELRALIAAG